MTPPREDRHERWRRKLADTVTCPECGTSWQRMNQQKQSGTTTCSDGCRIARTNRTRHLRADRVAVQRYGAWIANLTRHEQLGLRQDERQVVLGLMLRARREGWHAGRLAGLRDLGKGLAA